MIANPRKIFHTSTANQNDRVLLEVVAFATNVTNHLKSDREADLSDFSQRRVRLFGSGRVDTGTDTTTLRAGVQRRTLTFYNFRGPGFADQLVNGGHGS